MPRHQTALPRLLRALVLLALAACDAAPREPEAAAIPSGPAAPVLPVEVVRSWPHDPAAFTQGLVIHDGELLESTGLRGASSLRRVDLETGRVLQRVEVPAQYFAEGIAVLGERIFQLTWQEGTGFVYDRRTFAPLGTFRYDGEGWGLTTDGASLIMSDGTYRLRFLDPASFAVTRTLDVTDGGGYVYELNELEWIRGEIWANVWQREQIARIDPRSGRVIAWLDLRGLLTPEERAQPVDVLNGIAYDEASGRILVTGKLWPRILEIRVAGSAPAETPAAAGT